MRGLTGVAGLVALLVLAGCSGSGAGPAGQRQPVRSTAPTGAGAPSGPSTPSRPSTPSGPYVALGDSYTAGLQVAPAGGGPKGCGRSAVDYPALVAAGLKLAPGQFADVSCSSATTADLTAAQSVTGGPNPPQLDALSADTRLVTVGIGGNDADFMSVVKKCAEDGLMNAAAKLVDPRAARSAPCQAAYTAADGSDKLAGVLDTVGQRLAGVLGEIARRAPRAKVYVVGYPALLPADPASCAPVLGGTVTAGDLAFLDTQEQRLNAVLRERAAAAGAGFVDTYTPSLGHDMCAGGPDRWIEPPLAAPGRAPLHPNAAGQQGMAAAVLRSVEG
ncbi:GDSL-type esterase/lipase family protein [Kitasatospora sp. NBC_01287]|uniref:SGNH/GDSL hydrolase family protein n=1 Tax=Kitasatospora sp. NBC_01287 TaxID=2903573 RepID=UPI002258E470|nr:SGNH/GDSL hydrolase family protein [Kitasatospora sp. NBC_01287]MCX4749115.1 GDSL-type esterase/lipase family protein [Kitasatospora sp. NBC_01287]